MPFLEIVSNKNDKAPHILALKLDANTHVVLSDRPVFGVPVTIKSDLHDYIDEVINPGFAIGWVNYAALSKLGCTNDSQYFDAQDYVTNDKNQLCFTRPVKIISAPQAESLGHEILKFVLV